MKMENDKLENTDGKYYLNGLESIGDIISRIIPFNKSNDLQGEEKKLDELEF